ncbi:MAG TPA: hypothetical protein VFF31_08465 [Blastocatellia bacterium]|nr:hypothetical protein [Blastocatellia bacterium]
MSNRLIVCIMVSAMVLINLPVSRAQTSAAQGSTIKISSYMDDPFVKESDIRRIDASRVGQDQNGKPFLAGDRVSMIGEDYIYRWNAAHTEVSKFAWNPWPKDGRSNNKGNFNFADETRFPIHEVERDADGKPVLKDGLQVWKPRDLRLGITTAFAASNAVKPTAESWAGRDIPWGENGLLKIESQSFIEFNAFYSPSAKMVFFGIVPYRMPGETQVRIFETATSWEIGAHESGHAVHHTLKPNGYGIGFYTWSESFADQIAMWTSLRDSQRVSRVLAETDGNLNKSNSLTRFAEAFGAIAGTGAPNRDIFNDKKVSDTDDEIHDRSEVLTGALYKVFTLIYDDLRNREGLDDRKAILQAGEIMGTFLTHTTDYTPENHQTLEDVGKAYLKVDKELYGGRYQSWFVDEFTRREIFDQNSVNEWKAHEAAVLDLRLPRRASEKNINKLVQSNLDRLGIPPIYGLVLQSVTHDERFGKTMVRVQVRRESDGMLFDNEGILTFRPDGSLADYYTPLPEVTTSQIGVQSYGHLLALVSQAKLLGLDSHGGLLSIVRGEDGNITVEARVMRGEGINCWVDVYSLEHPEGQRREVIIPTFPGISGLQPNGVQILTADDLAN